jgi:hypothetical protein
MPQDTKTTMQKAFEFNMDRDKYGTIAEIGAGQEVSRAFFLAGGAAGTIAKTISAYDMSFSDAIYGAEESSRYVTESRLKKMLDKEFYLVVDRVGKSRPTTSTYFAFADTLTAKSYSQRGECHGWMGIKLQLKPNAEPSQIHLHVRMLDDSNVLQQEAVGVLGVNLIYGAYYHYKNPKRLIQTLGDNLKRDRLEIDMIRFSGPEFEHVDNRLMGLKLVEMELSDAVVFNADRKTLVHPSELFHKRDIALARGLFQPMTNVSQDIFCSGMEIFRKMEGVNPDTAMIVAEISVADLRYQDQLNMKNILQRVDCLNLLGYPVVVSNFLRHFRVRDYLSRYTTGRVAFILGIPNLKTLFNEDFYEGHKGGLLGAFASLFDLDTHLIVYPMRTDKNPEAIITGETFRAPEHLKYFYKFLLANKKIISIENYNNSIMHIWPDEVLERIKQNRGDWEHDVPEIIAQEIKKEKLFGFNTASEEAS